MCNSDLEVAQLAERRTVVPQVGGAIPSFETLFCIEIIPNSLGGQDTRLSPVRPGFNSRLGNFLPYNQDDLAEWLRRWPAKPLCFAREGSNPSVVVILFDHLGE